MRALTYMYFRYAILRTWMERAPRAERWPWYWVLVLWVYFAWAMA